MCKERPVMLYENKPIMGDNGLLIKYEKVEDSKARFLEWGTESYDGTVYSVAIVELPDGHVKLIHPEWLRFTDR
ncbi:MAG: hypothetical protein ACTSW7_00525 [Candidatus Thorarchaeota archaeon]|nr:hypothetical protein [Thermoplasmatales archaeon]